MNRAPRLGEDKPSPLLWTGLPGEDKPSPLLCQRRHRLAKAVLASLFERSRLRCVGERCGARTRKPSSKRVCNSFGKASARLANCTDGAGIERRMWKAG